MWKRNVGSWMLLLVASIACEPCEAQDRAIVEAKGSGKPVSEAVMKRVYETIKTPFKYGVILKGEKGAKVDCPSVFRHGNAW